ncbi:MAG TPA: AlpA family phage regulatory protein [Gemmataceae bacterium]|nr:AlpA family phage regulatory protein [Gemmataceae bacterium]
MSGPTQEPIDSELLNKPEVATMVQLKPGTVLRYAREGRFPSPIRLKSNRLAWRRQDVMDYMARLGESGTCTRGKGKRYRRTAAERRSALQGTSFGLVG